MRVAQPPAGPVKVFYEDSASDQESPLLQRGMCRPFGKDQVTHETPYSGIVQCTARTYEPACVTCIRLLECPF